MRKCRVLVKAVGYVRNKLGDFSSGIQLIEKTAGEVGVEIEGLYTEESDGQYENMEIAKGMVNSLKNCVLFVPDTSDLYFDEFAMVRFMEKLNENHVLLVDCSCPKFDNEIAFRNNGIENISDWLLSRTVTFLERYMRASAEMGNKSREPDIQKIIRKIEEIDKI